MQTWYTIAAALSCVITVMVFIFLVTSIKCIYRLIAILRECTKVFKSLAAIVLWPLIGVVLELAIFFYLVLVFFFVVYAWWDSGEVDNGVAVLFAMYHVFVCLWVLQTVRATIFTSMAGAIAEWFVTTNVPTYTGCCKCGLGIVSLGASTLTVLLKHLGSMAFGALVIAICQFLQWLLVLLDWASKDLQEKNCLLWLAFKCMHCCMYCLRKTVEFVSYFGFIFVAIRGTAFCRSCVNTFAFVLKYPAQTSINKTVQGLLSVLIAVGTPVLFAVICFYYLDGQSDYNSKYNPFWASLVVFLVARIVSCGNMSVFTVAIDTIYIAAFKDMEENKPPKYMSNAMRASFGLDPAKAEAESGKVGVSGTKVLPA
jgi:hypothetical protein